MREFSSELKAERVRIDGVEYEITEMTTAARNAYLRALSDTMEIRMVGTGTTDDQGREVMKREIVIRDLGGAQVEMLRGTMFRVTDDGRKVPVTAKEIEGWGAGLVEELVAVASELNGMMVPEETALAGAEKN